MFELRHLRHFIAVAEALNFRRAAEQLNMSQPPLSLSIRTLEQEVGERLLDRDSHHVELTSAGQLFLFEARQILARAERAIDLARGAERGRLHLSHLGSVTLSILPLLLRSFHERHPDVELRFSMTGTANQLEMLRQGDVDLGIIRLPIQDARDLRITILQEDRMMLAVPSEHPMAHQTSARLEDLANEAFIGFQPPEAQVLEGAFLAACQRAGFFPRVVQQAPQMLTKLSLVASGIGITIVPEAMRTLNIANVTFLTLQEGTPPLGYSLALVCRARTDNPAIPAFIASSLRAIRNGA